MSATAPDEAPEFHWDWFSQHIPAWRSLFSTIQPLPRKILEIGSFEGRATCFMLEHVLAPDAPGEVHCVDTWAGGVEHSALPMEEVHARFRRNVTLLVGRLPQHRVVIHRRTSFDAMVRLIAEGHAGTFDFVYVDGSHQAPDVLEDLVLSFRLCRKGGVVICDDYFWQRQKPGEEDVLDSPKLAIDSFTNLFRRRLRFLSRMSGQQLAYRKTAD
ncbi:class I SAM-dependent methyltransferase [Neoroseomonas soli]|uniref:Class I SAM-dependent methyltransferase n=1 Tax=Neoroseomonas soli TaxID=1081025 RepID=A0A9X9WXN0_9PROT|nr:class I SAM-dependent methyltransferase [Neoroseomonas soli]MBR0671909.1 class I SAM-dependent methyltransferase [Neoroseomonas soli]